MVTAIACAMYGLGDIGFGDLDTLAALSVAGIVLRMMDSGFNVDTIKNNKVQTAIAAALAFIAFVN